MNHKDFYEIHDNEIQYKPYKGNDLLVKWENIGRVADRFGDKVVLYDLKLNELFQIKYATTNFIELLEGLCQKLSIVHKSSLGSNEFSRSKFFSIVFYVVSAALLLFTIFTLKELYLPLFLLPFALACFWIFLAIQPKKIILGDNQLVLVNSLTKRKITYAKIKKIHLEKLSHYNSGEFIYIFIELTNGKKVKLHMFKEIMLLYVTLCAKLEKKG